MILDKAKMAHEYFRDTMAFIRQNNIEHKFDEIIKESWEYADAMQAEADKRNKPEIHLVSIDTEVNGNKMTLEFIHTDMKAAAKAIQDLLEDKQ